MTLVHIWLQCVCAHVVRLSKDDSIKPSRRLVNKHNVIMEAGKQRWGVKFERSNQHVLAVLIFLTSPTQLIRDIKSGLKGWGMAPRKKRLLMINNLSRTNKSSSLHLDVIKTVLTRNCAFELWLSFFRFEPTKFFFVTKLICSTTFQMF